MTDDADKTPPRERQADSDEALVMRSYETEATKFIGPFMLEFSKAIAPAAEQFRRLMEQFHTSMEECSQEFSKAHAPDMEQLQKAMEELRRTVSSEQVAQVMANQAWWWAPSMTTQLMMAIGRLVAEGREDEVTPTIVDFYGEDDWSELASMIRRWERRVSNPFRVRQPIFNAALAAHRHGDYLLSVPTLLPHIEGITLEFLEDLNVFKDRGRVKVSWQAITDVGLAGENFGASIISILIGPFGHALTETFYAQYIPRSAYHGMTLNRHAVLHGRSVDYATEANSLRCFLAFDSLHSVLAHLRRTYSADDLRQMYLDSVKSATRKQQERSSSSR